MAPLQRAGAIIVKAAPIILPLLLGVLAASRTTADAAPRASSPPRPSASFARPPLATAARARRSERRRRLTLATMSSSAATPAAEAEAEAEGAPSSPPARPFRVRTVTAFVVLRAEDFGADGGGGSGSGGGSGGGGGSGSGSGGVGGDEAVEAEAAGLAAKLDACRDVLRDAERRLTSRGYEVQTVRIATNPFGEWLTVPAGGDGDGSEKEAPSSPPRPEKRARTAPKTSTELDLATDRLAIVDSMLKRRDINFCSLGPSLDPGHTTSICPLIVASSGRLSCSASVEAGDVDSARAAAECILEISELGGGGEAEGAKDGDAASLPAPPPHLAGGLGNFRFGSSSRVKTVPFFPAARSPKSLEENEVGFAVGLENGGFARRLLEEAKSVANVRKVFHARMREELMCVQEACLEVVAASKSAFKPSGRSAKYLGIDTSLNPSLDEGGSVAAAIESLAEVRGRFGGTGTLAAAAAVTTSLQSAPDVLTTGYCGLMLPVLEDRRLAELGEGTANEGATDRLTIRDLLTISSVCGVGVDTVPVPGDVDVGDLASLILDVAALAGRWDKPLSCRIFPVPGGRAGSRTDFGSPYMCDSEVFDL